MAKPSLESMLKWMCLHGYFMRDDYDLRKEDPTMKGHERAWSLFSVEDGPLKRLAVFSGSYQWAVQKAFEESQKHEQNRGGA